ncbi:MAG: hypothetical protein C4530_24255 [Desulfobacteraceae bacterium]|nr:MAG: hypothetical protein C4530_24255 [Desulfobacteraceae bacterium]
MVEHLRIRLREIEEKNIHFVRFDSQKLRNPAGKLPDGILRIGLRSDQNQQVEVVYNLFLFCCGAEQVTCCDFRDFRNGSFDFF